MFLKQVRCQERERRNSYLAATVEGYWFKNTTRKTSCLFLDLEQLSIIISVTEQTKFSLEKNPLMVSFDKSKDARLWGNVFLLESLFSYGWTALGKPALNSNKFTFIWIIYSLLIILRHSFDIWNFLKLKDVWRKKIKLDRYHLHNHLRSYYVIIQIQFNFPMEIW